MLTAAVVASADSWLWKRARRNTTAANTRTVSITKVVTIIMIVIATITNEYISHITAGTTDATIAITMTIK